MKLRSWQTLLICFSILLVIGFPENTNQGLHAQSSANIGIRDFSFRASGVTAPTGQKPQSKLWFNDGFWWGTLFSSELDSYTIFRFDKPHEQWIDTGTVVDQRNRTYMDVLWDGSYLYIVSAGINPASTLYSAQVSRFSYNVTAKRYFIDAGFPVKVTNGGAEAVVLSKDTAGWLWITFTRNNSVYVAHSTGDDAVWTVPYVLPFEEAKDLDSDDISSIISFDAQTGVMWTNQRTDADYFAVHIDGTPDNEWIVETALQGQQYADDHLRLTGDSQGRIYAVVKTSLNDRGGGGPNAPLILLLVRDLDGTWTQHPITVISDNHTRPIVLLDEEHRVIYVFATQPCCQGGIIYYKQASLDDLSFQPGLGIPFMESGTDTHLNNPTSTKQTVNGASGLLVVASDYNSGYYFHNTLDLSSYCAVKAKVNVNLRAGPGTDQPILGTLPIDQIAIVTHKGTDTSNTGWWQLSTGQWVRSDVVTTMGACDS